MKCPYCQQSNINHSHGDHYFYYEHETKWALGIINFDYYVNSYGVYHNNDSLPNFKFETKQKPEDGYKALLKFVKLKSFL